MPSGGRGFQAVNDDPQRLLREMEGTGRGVETGAVGDAQARESAASVLLGELHPIGRVGEPGG
jgi:hypothetical protein